MVTDATITVGNLSAFLLYAAYVGVSLAGLSSFYSELMKGLGASSRLWELIDRKPKVPLRGEFSCVKLKQKTTKVNGRIRFYDLQHLFSVRHLDPEFMRMSEDTPYDYIYHAVETKRFSLLNL